MLCVFEFDYIVLLKRNLKLFNGVAMNAWVQILVHDVVKRLLVTELRLDVTNVVGSVSRLVKHTGWESLGVDMDIVEGCDNEGGQLITNLVKPVSVVTVNGRACPRCRKHKLVKHSTLDAFTKLGVYLVAFSQSEIVDRSEYLIDGHSRSAREGPIKVLHSRNKIFTF